MHTHTASLVTLTHQIYNSFVVTCLLIRAACNLTKRQNANYLTVKCKYIGTGLLVSLEKTSNSFALLDLRLSVPPCHHTPWGLSSWQSDRIGLPLQPLVATVAGPPGAPRRPVLRPWRPAATHPRVFRRGPGQPTLRQFLGLQNRTQTVAWVLPNALVRARCIQEFLDFLKNSMATYYIVIHTRLKSASL